MHTAINKLSCQGPGNTTEREPDLSESKNLISECFMSASLKVSGRNQIRKDDHYKVVEYGDIRGVKWSPAQMGHK